MYISSRPQTRRWLFFLCLVSAMPSTLAQTGQTAPSVETIIAHMAQARLKNESLFRPYVVVRNYTLFGKERKTIKSQVIAEITFVPPDSKKYAIQTSQGTGVGERIVRRMLEGEADITKDTATGLSFDNYDFRFVREEEITGQRCYVLELLPRRKDKTLLRGHIWVDVNTYLLRRTEGEPAKPVSWWLRDERIVFVYGDVGGMWLQTASESTANVRILGQHTMVSRDIDYKISELVASGPSPTAPRKPAGGDGGTRASEAQPKTAPIESVTVLLQSRPTSDRSTSAPDEGGATQ